MKMLSLLVSVILVVGTSISTAQQGPESLPIGEQFLGQSLVVSAGIALGDLSAGFPTVGGADETYAGGGLQLATEKLLRQLAEKFQPPVGKEGAGYMLFVSVDTRGGNSPVASQDIPAFPGTFKLRDGRIPSELLTVKLSYQAYISSDVTGMKGVLLVVRKDGEEILREVSENGVADKTCTLYPGNGNYYGPDVLQLHTRYVVPEVREPGIEGEVTVYLSVDHSVWATYDLLTGKKLASSEPTPPPPLVLTIRQLTGSTVTLLSKKSEKSSVIRIEVAGPVGATTVLEFDSGTGEWQTLGTVAIDHSGSGFLDTETAEGFRLYRAVQLK